MATSPSPRSPSAPASRPEDVGALLTALYEEHARMVLGLCRVLLKDPHEAEDAAQQTFLSAHRSMLAGRMPDNPPAWLATIARNECRARIRDRMRTPLQISDDAPATGPGPAQVATEREELGEALAALADLPERQREAVVLRSVCGMSYREVASALGTSVPVVETLVFRGRRKLNAVLRPHIAAHGLLVVPVALRDQLAAAIPGFGGGLSAGGAGAGAAAVGAAALAGGAGAGAAGLAASVGTLAAPVTAKLVAAATALTLGIGAAPSVMHRDAAPAAPAVALAAAPVTPAAPAAVSVPAAVSAAPALRREAAPRAAATRRAEPAAADAPQAAPTAPAPAATPSPASPAGPATDHHGSRGTDDDTTSGDDRRGRSGDRPTAGRGDGDDDGARSGRGGGDGSAADRRGRGGSGDDDASPAVPSTSPADDAGASVSRSRGRAASGSASPAVRRADKPAKSGRTDRAPRAERPKRSRPVAPAPPAATPPPAVAPAEGDRSGKGAGAGGDKAPDTPDAADDTPDGPDHD